MHILSTFTHASKKRNSGGSCASSGLLRPFRGAPVALRAPLAVDHISPPARAAKLYQEPDTYFITLVWTTVTSRQRRRDVLVRCESQSGFLGVCLFFYWVPWTRYCTVFCITTIPYVPLMRSNLTRGTRGRSITRSLQE